jgi:hypothetical protein
MIFQSAEILVPSWPFAGTGVARSWRMRGEGVSFCMSVVLKRGIVFWCAVCAWLEALMLVCAA